VTAFAGQRIPRTTLHSFGAAPLAKRFLRSAAALGVITAEAIRAHSAYESATTPAARRAVLEEFLRNVEPSRTEDTSASAA
jgi:hypothetical protein